MKNLLLIFSLITILPLSSNGQENGGFEKWDSTYTHAYADEIIDIYNIPDAVTGSLEIWTYESGYGVIRTTDAYSGLYALIIHNWYSYVSEMISYKQAIQDAPNYISGYYKYIADENLGDFPKGLGTVIVTNSNQDTISLTNFELDTTYTYKYFEFELNQATDESVANIQIIFRSADYGFGCSTTPNVCNFLYLDDIKLERQTTGTIHPKEAVKLYPNPTQDILHLKVPNGLTIHSIKLLDVQGKTLFEAHKDTRQFDIKNYANGTYIITIDTNKGLLSRKINIIK